MHSHRGPMRSTAWYGVPHVTSSTFGGLSGSEAIGGGCWPPGRPGSPSLASSPAPHGKGRNSRTRWGAAPRAGLRAPRRWRRGGRASATNKQGGGRASPRGCCAAQGAARGTLGVPRAPQRRVLTIWRRGGCKKGRPSAGGAARGRHLSLQHRNAKKETRSKETRSYARWGASPRACASQLAHL